MIDALRRLIWITVRSLPHHHTLVVLILFESHPRGVPLVRVCTGSLGRHLNGRVASLDLADMMSECSAIYLRYTWVSFLGGTQADPCGSR